MPRTMFNTPVLKTVLYLIAVLILKITGWKLIGNRPSERKFVAIAAPHTSNWDTPLMLCIVFAFKGRIVWFGKASLFKKPFGTILRFMGGIPVDRTKSHHIVEQSINLFKENKEMALLIGPEGSRNKSDAWKTGFYYIAYGAKVPIKLCFLDWGKKETGFGPSIQPTGDIESDMIPIQEFYRDKKGKRNDQKTEPCVIVKVKNKKCS